AVAQGEQARNVLKKKSLGLELFEKPHIVLEKLVARVSQETLRRIDREALARRSAGKNIKSSFFDAKLCPDFRRFYILNVAAVGPGFGMVLFESFNRL